MSPMGRLKKMATDEPQDKTAPQILPPFAEKEYVDM